MLMYRFIFIFLIFTISLCSLASSDSCIVKARRTLVGPDYRVEVDPNSKRYNNEMRLILDEMEQMLGGKNKIYQRLQKHFDDREIEKFSSRDRIYLAKLDQHLRAIYGDPSYRLKPHQLEMKVEDILRSITAKCGDK